MKITFVRFFLILISAFLFFGSYDSFISNNYISSLIYAGFGFLAYGDTTNPQIYLNKLKLKDIFSLKESSFSFSFNDFMNIIGYFLLTIAATAFIIEKFK